MLGVYYGCHVLTKSYIIEALTKKILAKLKVNFLELKDAFCCGGRLRSASILLNNYLSARVLSIAQKNNIEKLLVFCNWGFSSLKQLKYDLEKDAESIERISKLLARENLGFPDLDRIQVLHIVDFLHNLLEEGKIKPFSKYSFKVGIFPGCRAIRPRQIGINAKELITKFGHLIQELGFDIVDYPEKESCCGFSLLEYKKDTALALSGLILSSAKDAGAEILVVACPLCFEMLDYHQDEIRTHVKSAELPVVHILQLVGLSIGMPLEETFIQLNNSTSALLKKL